MNGRLSCRWAANLLAGWALGFSSLALTAEAAPRHPCGKLAWLDELLPLQADLERERGPQTTQALFDRSLSAWLTELDPRLHAKPGSDGNWTVGWDEAAKGETEAPITVTPPAGGKARDLYLAVITPACHLLRKHDPDKAGRALGSTWRALWLDFKPVFLAQLADPAAAFGYNSVSLSLDSPAFKSPDEAYSLQWMDRDLGIARLYLPNLHDHMLAYLAKDWPRLLAEAPLKTLIIDLRDSAGGDLETLNDLLARFLPTNTLAYTLKDRQGQESEARVKAAAPREPDDLRLIVLTSKKTRGSAELLAGALQANQRARIIGEPTAGMAGHKRIVKLSPENSLLLAAAWPRFTGQTDFNQPITPDHPVLAQDALNLALTFLAENGRAPQNPFIRRDEKRFPLVQAVLDRNQDEALRLIESGSPLNLEGSREATHRVLRSYFLTSGYAKTPAIGYPLATLTAALGLPKVLEAIGQRAPAELHRQDTDGRTALAYAAIGGYTNSTRILLQHGLDPLHPAREYPISSTPLMLAVHRDKAEVVGQMIAALPRERLTHTAVQEAVWVAAMKQEITMLKILLEGGAPPNYIARQGGTALIEAVMYSKVDFVRQLLKYGATVDGHPYRGMSVLQHAEKGADSGSDEAREILELIRAATKVDRGWEKSRETEGVEKVWEMIESGNKN